MVAHGSLALEHQKVLRQREGKDSGQNSIYEASLDNIDIQS